MYTILAIILITIIVFINRIRYYYNHKVVIEYYPNKKIKLKQECILYNKKKTLHGSTTAFYENGNIKEVLEYKNGMLNGIQRYYDENGNLIKKEVFDSGILLG